ncbi:transcription repressor OFP8-like [Zingiber officinale]|uniref:Transcription repressor n=1 Tax=Zingiber officinale TaxID=94328 RepID=A0A8J5G9L8_ZINOF|nr:transcription repressor OFP8-like [Zingiber officinale]KAG6503046.1 hypothetical protein ZIOFF_035335 [Zingiber officinale]
MESGRKLKERLARMFRFACKPSTSASAVLDRRQPDVLDPVFVDAVDCVGCRRMAPLKAAEHSNRRSVWRREERPVRETGGCHEAGHWEGWTCPPASSLSPPSRNSSCYQSWRSGRTIEKRNTMRLRSDAYGFTSSSSGEADDRDDDGFFSSEEKEESTATTFFSSSRSFSSGSSEFYASAKKSKKVTARRGSKCREAAAYWPAGGCKGCSFQPLVAVIDGDKKKKKKKHKIEEKRSMDPYKDFRRSMVEMIIQGQIFRAQDLESLLQSYLALNPRHLHPLILQAFSDIWVLLLGH